MANEQERKEAFLRSWFGVPDGVHWAHGMSNEIEQNISDCFDQAIAAWNTRPASVATRADATDEMVEAALVVDWDNEDERATVHNIWHAMTAKLPSSPAPATTDTGLETVDTQMRYRTIGKEIGDWSDWRDSVSPPLDPVRYDVETRELVTRSQAEELLAAERANTETALEQRNMTIAELARLEAENAAQAARIKELETERTMIVSHATMGQTDGIGLTVNDISVRVSALRNELYEEGRKTAEALGARIKELSNEVVFGFYEEEYPMYAQGYEGTGGCELCDPITAQEANGLVDKIKALEDKLTAAEKDRLPEGHVIIEQADMMDAQGRVSQTVQVTATGEEYERIVHVREAYGEDDNEYAR